MLKFFRLIAIIAVFFELECFADDSSKYCGDIVDYGEKYLSPELIRNADNSFLITCRTSDEIVFIDKNEKVVSRLNTPSHPSGIVISSDKKTAYVSCASSEGKILKLDLEKAKIISQAEAFHFPRSPILSKDGKTIFILNQFENKVRTFDADTLKYKSEASATREPYSACTYKEKLFVLNQIPEPKGGLFVEDIASALDVFDSSTLEKKSSIVLPNGSINCKEIISCGKFLLCTHAVARFNVPTTQLERGWIGTYAISIIDADTDSLYATVLLDDVDMGSTNPYGVACSPDGKKIAVSISGSNEIIVIDTDVMLKKLELAFAKNKKTQSDVLNDLSFLSEAKKRIKLEGINPRGIIFKDNNKLIVAMYLSDDLNIVDLETAEVSKIDIGGNDKMNDLRRGEYLFNSSDLSFQKWIACTTCHTETRSDALNWDLMNDGIGNPKQSKSMLFAHYTPPSMITGVRADAFAAVRKGIRHIQFARCSEEDASRIDKYLSALKPIPSPYKPDEKTLELGKKTFMSAGCGYCHSGEFFTDMKMHDAGTGLNEYKGAKFDTPTLREVWRTAPYLYDGRARSIKEVLIEYNKEDTHGKTSNLSKEELEALEKYILTL